MTRLYGVVHAKEISAIYGTRKVDLIPPPQILEDVDRASGVVAMEALNREMQHEVWMDLWHKADKAKLGERQPNFTFDTFWDHIEQRTDNLYFLESPPLWFKYSSELVKYLKSNNWVPRKGHDSREEAIYNGIRTHKLMTFARYIHEIERDEMLLRKLREDPPEIAIVGLGHSNHWMLHNLLPVDSYQTYEMDGEGGVFFNPDPLLNPALEMERTCLERAASLLSKGKFSDKRPDYVGIWDRFHPSKGYFEMFVEEKEGSTFRGSINDLLGSATFEGTIGDKEMNFVKRYTCYTENANDKPITYQGDVLGKEIFGEFQMSGGNRSPFYMVRASKVSPLDLFRGWKKLSGAQ
ncbi:MAG: hypothetical protein WCV90_02960 [Candidatus Woesearchaeota archaeon]|jgi:hypothetical protein